MRRVDLHGIDHGLAVRRSRRPCGVLQLVQRLAMMMLVVRVSLPGGYDNAVGAVVLYQHSCGVVVNTRILIQVDGNRDHVLSK